MGALFLSFLFMFSEISVKAIPFIVDKIASFKNLMRILFTCYQLLEDYT